MNFVIGATISCLAGLGVLCLVTTLFVVLYVVRVMRRQEKPAPKEMKYNIHEEVDMIMEALNE